ncbi:MULTISPECIES: MarR family winged helix-turn-helix transcriptional regulator [Myxococcus]|uniref:MarR family winged helix-turn-helix transcriptional regulator n=1 Tax=Myxococcus TaxID=32 RepID=UPI001891B1E0|nr:MULTISPECIES: MarR family transcriptional regulator [Myxococcus]MCK8499650.1 MarR family transcriptional regulator [Myxococcus fulvus]
MKRLRFVLEVHRATHRIGLFLEGAAPPLGLSQGEAHLLAYLLEAGDTSLSELHAAFGHKRSTLTSYMDRLEAKRLVKREARPEDRRSFQVSLTGPGRTLATRVHRRLETLEAVVLGQLGEEDVESLRTGLEAIAEVDQEVHPSESPKRRRTRTRST